MFCPNCGVQVSDTTPFCIQCGSPVKASAQAPGVTVAPPAATTPTAVPQNRKSGRKLLLWGALGVLVLGALIVVARHSKDSTGLKAGSDDSAQSKDSGANVGSGDSAVINVVKNGVLANYNTTTVGKAFEGTFQKPQWKTFVSPKGTAIVEFDGTVKTSVLTKGGLHIPESSERAKTVITSCMDSLGLKEEMTQEARQGNYWRLSVVYWMRYSRSFHNLNDCVNLPVTFQFALSADKETFSLAYVDEMFSDQGEKVMDFIYH